MSQVWDKGKKFWVPMRNLEIFYQVHMTNILHTARISNDDSFMFFPLILPAFYYV